MARFFSVLGQGWNELKRIEVNEAKWLLKYVFK